MTKFVIDEYTQRRGDPVMLEISCAQCSEYILTYQKDGPGPLLRCYWDRIHFPEYLIHNLEDLLTCRGCGVVVGKRGIYIKEDRLAYFLVEEAISINNHVT